MIYASVQEFITYFSESEAIDCTDVNRDGTVNEEILQRGLQAASDEIDGYISARYRLPLPRVPGVLRDVACDIARYRLTGNFRQETGVILERYQMARQFLRDVASEKCSLGTLEPTGTVEAVTNNTVQFCSSPITWGRNNTGGGGY